jgi:hypothetical protein
LLRLRGESGLELTPKFGLASALLGLELGDLAPDAREQLTTLGQLRLDRASRGRPLGDETCR